jgi:glucose/arabinose dehydrogenase
MASPRSRTPSGLPLLVLSSVVLLTGSVNLPTDFDEEEVVVALDRPTAFVYSPDGRLFVTEKAGRIRVVSAGGVLNPTPFATVSVNTNNDRGLIGITLDPDFPNTPYVYLAYTTDIVPPHPINASSRIHRITRMTANGDVAVPGSEVILIDGIPSDTDSHAGGALRFGPDHKLYVSTGDGATYNEATSLSLRALDIDQLAGKILRVNPDGSAPPDNPFYAGPEEVRSKVWQSGLRNPFRATFRPGTGKLYINDVGWNGFEEVNQGPPGASFGWPCFEGIDPEADYQRLFSSDCAPVTATPPLCAFPHRSGLGGAITGGAFYEGSSYPPIYRGAYFVTDFVTRWIKTITLAPDDSLASITDFASGDSNFRPVDLAPGPDGDLLYLNLASDFTIPSGSVHRIVYIGDGNHAPHPVASAEPASGYAPLSVSFSAAGSTDPDGDPLSCHWLFGDGGEADGCETSHVYPSNGPSLATLQLGDGTVTQEARVKVTVGSLPPAAVITEPPPYATFLGGDTIPYSGFAEDPDEGPIDPASLRWTVILHHNQHQHAYLDSVGPAGSFKVTGPGPDDTFAYEVVLTATDSSGLSDTRSVTVRENHPPIAVVDPAWIAGCVEPPLIITLDGGRAYDPDEQPFAYRWSQIDGPPVALAGSDSAFASFTAPILPGGAFMSFRLEVDDGHETDSAVLGLIVPDLTDLDADGDPACSDCAPLDQGLAAPGETNDLSIGADEVTVSWSSVPRAGTYDLDRGLITGPFVYNHTCLGIDLAVPSFEDSEIPAAGQAFYYVSRASNSCGAGNLGIASRGSTVTKAICPAAGKKRGPATTS